MRIHHAEIARTNADRYLREWVRLNGGPGLYTIVYDCDGHFRVEGYPHFIVEVGALTFKTCEAAQYIIDHHSDLLRTVVGEGRA